MSVMGCVMSAMSVMGVMGCVMRVMSAMSVMGVTSVMSLASKVHVTPYVLYTYKVIC